MNNVLYVSPATTVNAAVVYNMGFIRAPISDNGKSLSMNGKGINFSKTFPIRSLQCQYQKLPLC